MREDWNLLDPLNQFYLKSALPLPSIVVVEGENVPEPYRSLLVHSRDMTPTLEAAYQDRIHLRVLQSEVSDDIVRRHVVLVLDRDETPVEYGAIRIHLSQLPPQARPPILEGRLPLGRILQDFGIEHSSCPVAYFGVLADAQIGAALNLSDLPRVYGRRNRLWTPSGQILAEVLEILPPSPISS